MRLVVAATVVHTALLFTDSTRMLLQRPDCYSIFNDVCVQHAYDGTSLLLALRMRRSARTRI
jgi:hypothetical protein